MSAVILAMAIVVLVLGPASCALGWIAHVEGKRSLEDARKLLASAQGLSDYSAAALKRIDDYNERVEKAHLS